jgi:hypothetical protein
MFFKSLSESLLNQKKGRSHAKKKHKYVIRRNHLNTVNLRILFRVFCNNSFVPVTKSSSVICTDYHEFCQMRLHTILTSVEIICG